MAISGWTLDATTGLYTCDLTETGAAGIALDTNFATLITLHTALTNVENTALSTWAGTSSITTLGTIESGVWEGTAVAVAKGGTGATSAGTARTNLGVAIGTDVQAYGEVTVAVYATDAARDTAIPSPTVGDTVWNTVRGCSQTYNADFSTWVGISESDKPLAVNLFPEFQHLVPGLYSLCTYGGNLYSPSNGCYSDGVRMRQAARFSATADATGLDASSSGIIIQSSTKTIPLNRW